MVTCEELFHLQSTIIQMITTRAPLEKTLQFITKCMEGHFAHAQGQGSVMMYVSRKKQLKNVIHSTHMESFFQEMEFISPGPFEGTSGLAALLRRPIVTVNVQDDISWKNKRDLALRYGIRSACSFPLLTAQKELLGTLDLHFHQEFEPTEECMHCLETYSRLASLAIEFDSLEKHVVGEWEKKIPSSNMTGSKVNFYAIQK